MKVKEIGNLTTDPTYGEKDDLKYCNFNLAINNPFDKGKTEFVRVSAYGKQAESCRDYLQKGSQVCVEGNVKANAFVDRDGNAGIDLTHPDTDFPMFRLADVYLMYAEAVLRGGTGGDQGTALSYVNMVRERAFGGSTDGHITANDLNLEFILDERARELYWEAHRRTDLVRYGLFTGGEYLWPWKGNLDVGRSTEAKYDLFPIPDSDIGANPNLVQNPGY